MKRIINITFLALLFTVMFSCSIVDLDYSNLSKSSVYFVNQTPVRTLVLGDADEFDNAKDNKLQLSIPLVMGGLEKNTRDRKVEYVVAENLAQNLFTGDGEALVALPQAYYTFLTSGSTVVPKGSMQGSIDIQLTEAFLDDPDAIKNRYVIPLTLTSSETDSILRGKPNVENPDPRVTSHWVFAPKDYVLFGVKYMNKYHGNYLHFGKASVKNQAGNEVEAVVYSTPDIKNNTVSKLSTTGKNSISIAAPIRLSMDNPGYVNFDLTFANDGAITVKESEGASITVNGNGSFVENAVQLGGAKRNRIALDYSFTYDYFTEPVVTTMNSTLATYSGVWTHNGESGNYNGDRSYSNTVGSSFELSFYGFKISIFHKTAPSYGWYDVYIDDELVATDVSTVTDATTYQVKTFEKADLTNGPHKLKCVIKSPGKNVIFDFFESAAYGSLPNGKYTWHVKDTLVIRDRAIEFETFKPVIK